MRVMIASDDEQVTGRIRETLSHGGLECEAGHAISLDAAADRASRLFPDLVILALPEEPGAGLEALRDICHTIQDAHVLVIGPATDPKLILKTQHIGADEYLDAATLDAELSAALVRFKTRRASVARHDKPGRVITVLGSSGGNGSSILAANLSIVLAQQYGSCGLMDLRLAVGDLASMLELKPVHTIADLSERAARVDRSMFEEFLARHPSGVHLLAAPRRAADIEQVTEKGVRRALALGRVVFPYVVVDLDNRPSNEQAEVLWQSDLTLLVVRLDYTSVRNARRTIDGLKELGIGLSSLYVVVNRYGQAKQLRISQAEEALGMSILHCLPCDPAPIHHSVNAGVPVVLCRSRAKISRSIRSLAGVVTSMNGRCRPS